MSQECKGIIQEVRKEESGRTKGRSEGRNKGRNKGGSEEGYDHRLHRLLALRVRCLSLNACSPDLRFPKQVVQQLNLIDDLLRALFLHDTKHRFIRNDVNPLFGNVGILQVIFDAPASLLDELLSCIPIEFLLVILVILVITVVPHVPHEVTNVLIRLRADDIRGDLETPAISEDGNVGHSEAIVE